MEFLLCSIYALEIQSDAKLREIVERLKEKFLTRHEALCHGDLHTGSILVTEADTRIIDDAFEKTFRELWKCPRVSVDEKLKEIWGHTLRLMGVEIIRRTIGVAHNADFESIANRHLKASTERKALEVAKDLLLKAESLVSDAKSLELYIRKTSLDLRQSTRGVL